MKMKPLLVLKKPLLTTSKNSLMNNKRPSTLLSAISASQGIGIGRGVLLKDQSWQNNIIKVSDPNKEIRQLSDGISKLKQKLGRTYKQLLAQVGPEEAQIIDAHKMILEDPEIIAPMKQLIKERGYTASKAIKVVFDQVITQFEVLEDDYFKARSKDISEIQHQLLETMAGKPAVDISLPEASIIISKQLRVAEIIALDKTKVAGICLVEGGVNDHVAILARAYQIPMLTGCSDEVVHLALNQRLILDGGSGKLYINPDGELKEKYLKKYHDDWQLAVRIGKDANIDAVTTDGRKITINGNIGSVEEAEMARQSGADGLGLVRTELIYSANKSIPDVDRQEKDYKTICRNFPGKEIIIRLFDIGGDKAFSDLVPQNEANPAMGLRGIRLALQHSKELLLPQLAAICKCNIEGNVKIMLPMITQINEVKAVKETIEEIISQNPGLELPSFGIMVETPASVFMADQLADLVDFFSIGTNDLIQYIMAADRNNGSITELTNGFQPAVLRAINHVVQIANEKEKELCICGELAANPQAMMLMVGLGINRFSVSPMAIPRLKDLVRGISFEEVQKHARQCLELSSAEEIETVMEQYQDSINKTK